jgi:hypothetical protein
LVHELSCDQPNTTSELLDITTQHASGEEAIAVVLALGDGKIVPGDSRATPSKATGKGAKGGKMGQKWHPRWVTITASGNDDDKEVDDADDEYVMPAEGDFKHQARKLKDHFEKLLEASCPSHTYLVKHKLKIAP